VGGDDGVVPELVGITTGNRRRSQPVRAIAREQEGIVARAQLLAAGVSGSAIDRALRSGARHRVLPGVYSAVAPELLTEDGRTTAALLTAGEGALLSHGTAAWRWRIIPAPPSVIQLAVPRPRTATRAAPTSEPHCTNTLPATARSRATSSAASAGRPTSGPTT
jgi:hypothetical protein